MHSACHSILLLRPIKSAALLALAANTVFEFTHAGMHDKFSIEQHPESLQVVGDAGNHDAPAKRGA